jgi:heterotetrameric sarcosine oxidase gamma subunit
MSQSIALRGPLHHWQQSQGAQWSQEEGWDLPSFGGDKAAPGSALAAADESPLGKFLVEGTELAQVLSKLGHGAPAPGKVGASSGGHVYRIHAGQAWLLVPLAQRAAVKAAASAQVAAGCGHCVDMSSALASFVLGGPGVERILTKLFSLDLRTLPVGSVAATGMQGYKATLASHEKGWRILVGREDAQDTWDLIQNAGHEYGLANLGWSAAKAWLWSAG